MRKKLLFVLVLTTILNLSAFAQFGSVSGNGNVVKKTRNVGSFSEIEARGVINLFLTQGSKNEILIEADENLHDIITTDVEGGRLIIKNEENVKNFEKFNVFVTFREINALSGSGATDIEALSPISTSANFYVSSSGASDMLLREGLDCRELNISGSGSADIELMDVSSNKTEVQASGSVDLEIEGKTNAITMDASGSSDISAKNFVANNASVSASGSSDIYVHAKSSIMVNANGSSDVYYWGNPTNKQIKSSRAADVELKQ